VAGSLGAPLAFAAAKFCVSSLSAHFSWPNLSVFLDYLISDWSEFDLLAPFAMAHNASPMPEVHPTPHEVYHQQRSQRLGVHSASASKSSFDLHGLDNQQLHHKTKTAQGYNRIMKEGCSEQIK
jgi:hypothetical protein